MELVLQEFYRVVRENPDKDFLLTKVGCGIAGYDEDFMKGLFMNPPANIVLPDDSATTRFQSKQTQQERLYAFLSDGTRPQDGCHRERTDQSHFPRTSVLIAGGGI